MQRAPADVSGEQRGKGVALSPRLLLCSQEVRQQEGRARRGRGIDPDRAFEGLREEVIGQDRCRWPMRQYAARLEHDEFIGPGGRKVEVVEYDGHRAAGLGLLTRLV